MGRPIGGESQGRSAVKAVIVCVSEAHGNTRKVAEVVAEVVGAQVVDPDQVGAADLAAFDLVGFASGIRWLAFHPRLRRFVAGLPAGASRKAFVVATGGLPEPPFRRYLGGFEKTLAAKGFDVLGTYSCRGLDTYSPFGLFGGLNNGHPDAADLAAARSFAEQLRG
ncbi:flavodoxin domain-containing protein [Nocardia takedensis]|uniref:flavodoxin domain-containing protein n=1 Tax=Nocardia takedensis TaxID=259390 RepID=UPI001FDFBCEA|nr:flavodoxin domain-containing protein [Nocardia takedensis]